MTRTEAELDEVLDALAECHDVDVPYLSVWFHQSVWHEDGSSSWEEVPQGIWGVRIPRFDGRDAIVGATLEAFPPEWQLIMRCRWHVPYATLGPAVPVALSVEPF